MNPYPILELPPRLLETGGRATLDEAKGHLEWLTGIVDERIQILASYFNVDLDGDPEPMFKELGVKAAAVLRTHEFSYAADDKRQLTHAGISLAVDIGLLMARMLMEWHPHVRWSIGNEENDEGLIYRAPVLRGLWQEDASPILGSIRETRRVLWGHVESYAWLELFYIWAESAAMASDDPEVSGRPSPIEAGPDFMSAVFNALDRGIEKLADGDTLIPFLVWASADESWIQFFDDADFKDAVATARQVIKELPGDTLYFLLVYDGYFTYDDVQYDAVILEGKETASESGMQFVQRYRISEDEETVETIGDPALVAELTLEEIVIGD